MRTKQDHDDSPSVQIESEATSVVTDEPMYIADGKTGNPTEEPCDPESCHGCANEALTTPGRHEGGAQ